MGASGSAARQQIVPTGPQLNDLPDDIKVIIFWNIVGQPPGASPFDFAALCNTCRSWRAKIFSHIEHWDRERLGLFVQASGKLLSCANGLKTLDLSNVNFQNPSQDAVAIIQKHASTLECLKISCIQLNNQDIVPMLPGLTKLTRLEALTAHPTMQLIEKRPPALHVLRVVSDQYFSRAIPDKFVAPRDSAHPAVDTELKLEWSQWKLTNYGCSSLPPLEKWDADPARNRTLNDLKPAETAQCTAEYAAGGMKFLRLSNLNLSIHSAPVLESLGALIRSRLRFFSMSYMMNSGGSMHGANMLAAMAKWPQMPHLEFVDCREYSLPDLASVFLNPELFPSLTLLRSHWMSNEEIEKKKSVSFKLRNVFNGARGRAITMALRGSDTLWRDDGSFAFVMASHPFYSHLICIRFFHRHGMPNEKEPY